MPQGTGWFRGESVRSVQLHFVGIQQKVVRARPIAGGFQWCMGSTGGGSGTRRARGGLVIRPPVIDRGLNEWGVGEV